MIPLGDAIAGERISGEKVGNVPIPEEDQAFPTFRMPIRDTDGGIAYWWFWDGEGLRYQTEIGPEAEKFPMREVMALDRFLERLG